MLAANRRLFTRPYDYLLTKPTSQLKTFFLRMKPTIKIWVPTFAPSTTTSPRPSPNTSLMTFISSCTSNQNLTSWSPRRDLDSPATRRIVFTTLHYTTSLPSFATIVANLFTPRNVCGRGWKQRGFSTSTALDRHINNRLQPFVLRSRVDRSTSQRQPLTQWQEYGGDLG
jgi:hypothetical protein